MKILVLSGSLVLFFEQRVYIYNIHRFMNSRLNIVTSLVSTIIVVVIIISSVNGGGV